MSQRGITKDEIEQVLNEGWFANDAKSGTIGKMLVFSYNRQWERKFFKEKEVSVYYKVLMDRVVLLTAKARYGEVFLKEGGSDEIRV